jgi:hypothetical protein
MKKDLARSLRNRGVEIRVWIMVFGLFRVVPNLGGGIWGMGIKVK